MNVALEGYADSRINNLPSHALKFFSNFRLSEHFRMHFNGRLLWEFNQIEMMDQFLAAHRALGRPEQLATMQAIYDELLEEGYTRPSFTSNLQLSYENSGRWFDYELAIYAMNLIRVNHVRNIIQYWGSGNQRQYPRQCGFMNEPIALGMSVSLSF